MGDKTEIIDIYGSFYRYATLHPSETMLITQDGRVSYKKALSLVDQYANEIQDKSRSLHNKQRIVLYLEHSYKVVLVILAVIKTGNSYVPLKKESLLRLNHIADICNSEIIISDEDIPDTSYSVINIENITSSHKEAVFEDSYKYSPDEEVYVLFTSGSTGEPKGGYRSLIKIWIIS